MRIYEIYVLYISKQKCCCILFVFSRTLRMFSKQNVSFDIPHNDINKGSLVRTPQLMVKPNIALDR